MPSTRWSRRVAEAFTERLGYKTTALFFAVALWLVASGEETAAHYVSVRFVPVLDSTMRLVGDPPRVRALVSGPTRELLKLYAVPPVVRHAFGAGTPDTARLELRASDIDLPSGVERVVVRDVQPRAVALRFAHTSDLRAQAVVPALPAAVPNDSLSRTDSARASHDSMPRSDSVQSKVP